MICPNCQTKNKEALQRSRFEISPTITFPYADIHAFPIANEVSWKLGQYDQVLEMGGEYIAVLQDAGLRMTLPDAYYYRGLALLAKGENEAAKQALTAARVEAEAIVSRRTLWRILAELARLEEQLGNSAEAKELRRQAQETIQYIADHAGSPERRDSFLALAGEYIL